MTTIEKEPRVASLPKWAQELLRVLQAERDTAVRELHEWADSQTQSPFSIGELVCDGEQRGPAPMTRYVQTRRIRCDHGGTSVEVTVRAEGHNRGEDVIEIRLGLADTYSMHSVGLFATSFNQFEVRAIPRKAKP